MPQYLWPCYIFNRLQSRFSKRHYQPLDSSHDQFNDCIVSPGENYRRTSCDSDISSQQHSNSDVYNDTSEHEENIHCGSTKRITSLNSHEKYELFYEIHSGFTSTQEALIEDALQIVADRIFKPEILKNMYQVCGADGCFATDDILVQSNLSQTSMYFNRHLLLHYQLMSLKDKSKTGEFPIINICSVHGDNEQQSNSHWPCVFCISHGRTSLIEGDFEIELNHDKLNGSVKNNSNALFWAGEIVYQILSNLGHQSNDNTLRRNRSQIKVFKQCFLLNGHYIPLQPKS